MRTALCLSAGVVALLVCGTAHAKTFFVDAGESIQQAVDEAAARPGPDHVRIAAGNFSENIEIEDEDAVTLSGAGAGVTVISNGGEHIITIEDSGFVTIQHLTVTSGRDGIHAENVESLSLLHVDAVDNESDGVDVEGVGSVRAVQCRFSDNQEGDGIKVENGDSVDIVDTDCSGQLDNDGLDFENVGSIELTRVTATGNADEGLEVDDSGSISIHGGEFVSNDDDGVDLDDTGSIFIVNLLSRDNDGNGLQIEAEEDQDTTSAIVINSEFSSNGEDGVKTTEDDAAIEQLTLVNVLVTDNAESGLDISAVDVTLTNVVSEANGADDVLP